MSEKEKTIKKITNEIFNSDFALDSKRKSQVSDFVYLTVNGDLPISHLTIEANLSKDKSGLLVYILTNIRLIKIDIDNQETKSASFFLDKLIGSEYILLDDGKAEVSISFEKCSFGLRYPSQNKEITDFFHKIEKLRMQGLYYSNSRYC